MEMALLFPMFYPTLHKNHGKSQQNCEELFIIVPPKSDEKTELRKTDVMIGFLPKSQVSSRINRMKTEFVWKHGWNIRHIFYDFEQFLVVSSNKELRECLEHGSGGNGYEQRWK